ncbi:SWI/SNF complex subunit SWI3A [Quillaja saponaria]|uniref:SWI/SNF complex subunit SWI3A n=1 Tax=Quillaja saponaria TaxID=32244 RepID=A0AAD7P8H7_QUISA|nr:SWI/SNF complex subunit SWI3A [Quillaja saponaria]
MLKFFFLDKSQVGIYHGAPSSGGGGDDDSVVEVEEMYKVRIQEGAPNGIRVVAVSNSLKPILMPPNTRSNVAAVDNGFKLPLLASYSVI